MIEVLFDYYWQQLLDRTKVCSTLPTKYTMIRRSVPLALPIHSVPFIEHRGEVPGVI
jgi:hypothetical protein